MRLNPDNIKKNICALDVGSSSLKIAIGDFNKDRLDIKKIIYIPIPEGVFVSGEFIDVDKLALTLKHALKQHKLKVKNCFCCFESSQVITREVTIPSPDKSNIQDMAKFEVEQFLPIELSNYTVQSIILKEIEIDGKPFAEMLVTAFPLKYIEKLHQLITLAGLKPLILDTQANAFSKLIENQFKINGNDYHREGTSAFIDFGYDNISISIFSKGKFRFNRILKVGGRDLDNNIAKFMDIPVDEAEKRKLKINNINYTVDEFDDNSKVINVVKSTMGNWFDEIIKIFRYYSTKANGNGNIEYIYIYGGGAKINGMSDYLESYFKIPVEYIKKISSVSISDEPGIEIAEVLNTLGVMYRR